MNQASNGTGFTARHAAAVPWRRVALCLCIAAVAGCAGIPPPAARTTSAAFAQTLDSPLGRAVAPLVALHPGQSGVYPLADGRDAFAARMALAQVARLSLDVQYYIWRNDMTGQLLLDALREAAGRGVRVRLLMDDNNTKGLDPVLSALDAHPNIEVRLFNPFAQRSWRWFGYLTDFARLNRRMHNKSFTADNQATIIGGRNIGDEYFAASDGVLFADLDVLAVGPVVDSVSLDFDRYWASQSAYPAHEVLAAAAAADPPQPAPRQPAPYAGSARTAGFAAQLLSGSLPLEWARTRMVSDDPAKGLGKSAPEDTLPPQLREAMGEPRRQVSLVSPYFVPSDAGVAFFSSLAGRGVKVRVLTNSLEATDVDIVHSGYVKRRKDLLRGGVGLWEMKRRGPLPVVPSTPGSPGSVGSSGGSSLHAKTFSIDDERVFIGSFNFDPRSASLNTEMGFVIDSPALARRIAAAFETDIPGAAYEVKLSDDGKLYWLERAGAGAIRHDTEPGTTFWQRSGVFVMSLLPIDWLL